MSSRFRAAWVVACALASAACGGVSEYEGLWAARSIEGENSCTGPFENDDPEFVIRLREGEEADLEYVSYEGTDVTDETCVQEFSVDGDVATIEDGQDCSYEYDIVDSVTGEMTQVRVVLEFPSDRLELDGDKLRETGESRITSSDGSDCEEEFEIEFERIED